MILTTFAAGVAKSPNTIRRHIGGFCSYVYARTLSVKCERGCIRKLPPNRDRLRFEGGDVTGPSHEFAKTRQVVGQVGFYSQVLP